MFFYAELKSKIHSRLYLFSSKFLFMIRYKNKHMKCRILWQRRKKERFEWKMTLISILCLSSNASTTSACITVHCNRLLFFFHLNYFIVAHPLLSARSSSHFISFLWTDIHSSTLIHPNFIILWPISSLGHFLLGNSQYINKHSS